MICNSNRIAFNVLSLSGSCITSIHIININNEENLQFVKPLLSQLLGNKFSYSDIYSCIYIFPPQYSFFL